MIETEHFAYRSWTCSKCEQQVDIKDDDTMECTNCNVSFDDDGALLDLEDPETADERCPECGSLNDSHGPVHVRHGNGGGSNQPCSRANQVTTEERISQLFDRATSCGCCKDDCDCEYDETDIVQLKPCYEIPCWDPVTRTPGKGAINELDPNGDAI